MSSDQPTPGSDLPADDDELWDEITADTVALLHRLRTTHRHEKLGGAAYTAYIVALVGLVYVLPYVVRALQTPVRATAGQLALQAAVPTAVTAALLAVTVAFARDGSWRGPALLDLAACAWLLPAPVRRAALLRPPLRLALGVTTGTGAVAGAVAGVLLRPVTGGAPWHLVGGGAATGALVAALGVAADAAVEEVGGRTSRPARLLTGRGGAWLWVAAAAAGALAVAVGTRRLTGPGPRVVAEVLLWSGPWGWAAQPLVAATAAGRSTASLWPAGLAAATVTVLAGAVVVDRRIGGVPGRVLRSRALALSTVSGGLATLQPRRAKFAVQQAQGWTVRARVRLPVPRRLWLLVPWRDATALLRTPSRLVWGLLWWSAAMTLATVGGLDVTAGATPKAELGRRILVAAAVLVTGYLGASQLLEPARIDADDPRRMRITPMAASRLAVWHLAVPGIVLAVTSAAGAGVAFAVGHSGTGVGRLVFAAPGLLGAALVSSYRGDPPAITYVGTASPMGDTSSVQVLGWYLRGPLVAVLLLEALMVGARALAEPLAVAAAFLLPYWGSRRAESVVSPKPSRLLG